MTSRYAIIVAGGVGSRSGDSLPKQFHFIGNHPMLWWTLKAFYDEDPETRLIVVIHPDFVDYWKKLSERDCPQHILTTGGKTRKESVAKGLALIPDDKDGLVAVHDAARPLASKRLIREGWEEAVKHRAVIPGLQMSDSLREGSKENSRSVDRSRFFAVQTPQVFNLGLLKEAYAKAEKAQESVFTDDASVVEWAGNNIYIYDGEPTNIKVTFPGDFRIAEDILLNRKQ